MLKDNLLIELGTEELPPNALYKMIIAFKQEMASTLDKANLSFEDITHFATPRRLALKINGLIQKQPDSEIERKGPAIKAAFDENNNPTKACLGFAKSVGAEVKDLIEKSGYLYYTVHHKGKTLDELIPELLNKVIQRIPVPKRMRWGDKTVEFSRPAKWLVILYGQKILPATVLDCSANRLSYGHRFHHPEAITLNHADDYDTKLEKAKVIANFEKRREIIRKQVDDIAKQQKAIPIIDEDLLDEVTGLVEWPVAIQAEFAPQFLSVPAESLISAMASHQKCFALLDETQNLLPTFITISNIESKDSQRVKAGNERVMHARLSDAEFFYQTDLQTPLASHIDKLKTIIFQRELGSLYDKSQRIKQITLYLAKQFSVDDNLVTMAAELSKTDLVTDMVGEFPELQGIMGYYYASHEGLPLDVNIALKEQYLPRFSADSLPTTLLGALLAIADRIDTIVGIFGLGKVPTGEKDPFALRRAAVGIIRIIIEKDLDINLWQLIKIAIDNYQSCIKNPETQTQTFEFILERLKAYFSEHNVSGDIFAAVYAKKPYSPLDFARRIKAIQAFKQLADAKALAAANKRVSRILQKEAMNNRHDAIDNQLLTETAEIQLATLLNDKQTIVAPLFEKHDYQTALTELADLRPAVDIFFDEVLVMDKDEKIKNNRLNLLNQLRQLFLEVADISLLN